MDTKSVKRTEHIILPLSMHFYVLSIEWSRIFMIALLDIDPFLVNTLSLDKVSEL